jgi:hypothetical protein
VALRVERSFRQRPGLVGACPGRPGLGELRPGAGRAGRADLRDQRAGRPAVPVCQRRLGDIPAHHRGLGLIRHRGLPQQDHR